MAIPERATRDQRPHKKFFHKRKFCKFCNDSTLKIEYKQPGGLKEFVTERGKIMPRRISGSCAKHQRELTVAIKKGRMIALMPYVVAEGK